MYTISAICMKYIVILINLMRYEWVDSFKIDFYPELQFKNVCDKIILNALFVRHKSMIEKCKLISKNNRRTTECVSLFLDRLSLISVIVQPLKDFF